MHIKAFSLRKIVDSKTYNSLYTVARIFDPTPLYIVGGFVRNMIIGLTAYDFDITSALSFEEVKKRLDNNNIKYKLINPRLFTLLIIYNGLQMQYTSFRKDSQYDNGHHTPNECSHTTDIVEDSKRRDFTMNAIYYDILSEEIIDPLNGIEDIKNRTLKPTRTAEIIFSEDALRMLRMVRMLAELKGNIALTSQAINECRNYSHLLKNISAERIVGELDRLLIADTAFQKFNIESDTLDFSDEVLQKRTNGNSLVYNGENINIDNLSTVGIIQALRFIKETNMDTAIFDHKFINIDTVFINEFNRIDRKNRFVYILYCMNITVEDARKILEKLKISTNNTDFILSVLRALIELYLFNPYVSKKPEPESPEKILEELFSLEEKPKRLDRALIEPYSRYIIKYIDVIDDVINTGISIDELKNKMQGIVKRYDYMITKELPFTLKQLAVSGNDLLDIGIEKRKISQILNEILFAAASSKIKNNKETMLEYIRETYKDFIIPQDFESVKN